MPKKYPRDKKTVDDFLCHTIPSSFALVPTNLHEIMGIANSAKSTRSEGPDGIDPMVAKKSIGQVAMVVSDIINASFDRVYRNSPARLKIWLVSPQCSSKEINLTPLTIGPFLYCLTLPKSWKK